jgi:hypothetical protein
MAPSIFVIHLFGDFWGPALVGLLADSGYDPANPGAGLRQAILVLPAVMCVSRFSSGAGSPGGNGMCLSRGGEAGQIGFVLQKITPI